MFKFHEFHESRKTAKQMKENTKQRRKDVEKERNIWREKKPKNKHFLHLVFLKELLLLLSLLLFAVSFYVKKIVIRPYEKKKRYKILAMWIEGY